MSSGSFKNKTNGGNRLNYSLKILAIRQVVALVIGWATAFLGQRYGVDAANSVIQNGWQFAVRSLLRPAVARRMGTSNRWWL